MKRIVTVVGARPQFIKAAVISRLIRDTYSERFVELLVHTGQHYDDNMAGVFFRELDIPVPDINLGIGSVTHGKMTGRMLEKLERVLLDHDVDLVLVYGDTNSTLAGALAASKLNVPVAHVEAGLRSFNKQMPEEQNRVLTDHLSSILFCPTQTAVGNLQKENIMEGVVVTGDVMLDAMNYYSRRMSPNTHEFPENFYLLTIHRAENTDDPHRLRRIMAALGEFKDLPAVFPIHPRTANAMHRFGIAPPANALILPPQGYLSMIYLEKKCQFVVTDSGGVQKEAYFFKKPCITVRSETEWIETVHARANVVVDPDADDLTSHMYEPPNPDDWPPLFGDGNAGGKILDTLL